SGFGTARGGSEPDRATLESATVKVAIMPYLTSNTVEVEEIVLEKPTFVFEKLKDGSGKWHIAAHTRAAGSRRDAGAERSAGRRWQPHGRRDQERLDRRRHADLSRPRGRHR